jgi:MFS transporter, ACS family, solute carrier family 17 (sodium-dependent inorganic phosphate cotransporter), other
MRSVLNITITQMVRREADFGNHTSDNTCPASDGGGKAARDGFDWSEELQGTILGCFFYGYVSSELNQNFYKKKLYFKITMKALTHVPGGILSTKYGGKYTLSLGILSTAIFTLITPAVIEWGNERQFYNLVKFTIT